LDSKEINRKATKQLLEFSKLDIKEVAQGLQPHYAILPIQEGLVSAMSSVRMNMVRMEARISKLERKGLPQKSIFYPNTED
jgi:hypothetical protein